MNERRKMISFVAKAPPKLSELFGIFEFLGAELVDSFFLQHRNLFVSHAKFQDLYLIPSFPQQRIPASYHHVTKSYHRIAYVGGDLKAHSIPAPSVGRIATHQTGYSGPHPACASASRPSK